ncbi:MAG: hypothetical protein DMG89_11085 [Acidobacteria bacterium]|nr:MAG: hypothetical protein DMG89_11085 [Acidobacteriota bacterium]
MVCYICSVEVPAWGRPSANIWPRRIPNWNAPNHGHIGFYRHSPSPVEVKIGDVLDNVLNFYGPAIRPGKVIVEKRYDSKDVIRGFPSEITQVFSNLVENALEALTPGGILQLHVLASRDWRNPTRCGVRVYIADNGPGISGEDRRRIFEPFFTTKGEKGTGLGLWVAKGIVASSSSE